MPRPLSQLVYTRIQDGSGGPRVITLHRHDEHGGDVRDYGLAAAPTGRVIGLESYKGVFVGRTITGYTWFIGPERQPSPVYFGDAMAEIERFLWDEVDRQADAGPADLPFLLGVEQGAIMALAMAAATPDLLSGVIAVDGFLPVVPGWDPPLAPLDGLPILLLGNAPAAPAAGGLLRADVLSGPRLDETLTRWGGRVTRIAAGAGTSDGVDTPIPAAAMATWLAAQPRRSRVPTPV